MIEKKKGPTSPKTNQRNASAKSGVKQIKTGARQTEASAKRNKASAKQNKASAKQNELPPFAQVYEIVKKIPRGKVLTYGEISKRMNKRLSAAAVGWALNGLGSEKAKENGYTSKNVPWHRVIDSEGKISTTEESPLEGADGSTVTMQQFMLEQEGIVFARDGCVDLKRYLWRA